MMDDCTSDVTIEFLAIAFHNILYYASVYPLSIFESRKKYNIVVFHSVHPEVNQYLDLCLKSIAEFLKSGQLKRIEFIVTNHIYEPLLNFVFDFEKMSKYDETSDPYLIQCEHNLRAFCLKLAAMENNFKKLPEDTSFAVYLHTNESSAVAMAANPDMEEFPMIEVEKVIKESDRIIPIRRFGVRQYTVDTYVEINLIDET